MSTINPASAAAYTPPKQRILDNISKQASVGTISSADETALDSAVNSISSDLQSSASSSSSPLDPSQLGGRVDDLISQQVGAGTLTSDQADTLKQILSQGHGAHGGHGGHHGVGGAGGAGGLPPLPTTDDSSSDSDDPFSIDGTASTGITGTSGTSSDSTSDLLATFMKQLQASQSQASGYGADGSSGNNRFATPQLLNFQV